MKTIIAGGRDITDYALVVAAVDACGWDISEVVSGTARGVDALGESYAAENGLPVKRFRPDWNQFGRAAGPMRNRDMAEYADALLVIWDGEFCRPRLGGGRGARSFPRWDQRGGCLVSPRSLPRSRVIR